jgi:acetyl-CoA acetyltransferase
MADRDPVVVGVATTRQERRSGRTGVSLALEALRAALDDAGMALDDIGGWYSSIDPWPGRSGVNHFYDVVNWAHQLDLPLQWSTGAVNASDTGAPALLDAALAVQAGYIEAAAIVLGHAPGIPLVSPQGTADHTQAMYELTGFTGSFTAAQFALIAQRHMYEYGTTAEQLAEVSATVRNYGSVNPAAFGHGRGPYSAADILDAPMVAEPLTRLMCANVNDGGAAIIVTTAERARDLRPPPVRVLGGGDQVAFPAYAEVPLLTRHSGAPWPTSWVDAAFARAGLVRADVDVAELYDGFASWVVTQWEMLGFCDPGEGGPFVASGAMALDGPHPTCTDGGCHSFGDNGRPSLYRIVEAVRQLRGDVDDHCPGAGEGSHTYEPSMCRSARQPQVAMAVTMGPPVGGGSLVLFGTG